jgi:branched-chain amino acid transport system substrate-binding protein
MVVRETGRSGGTGRRTGLKIRRPSGRVGSIPTFGMTRGAAAALAVVLAAVAAFAAGCGGSGQSACAPVEYGGAGSPTSVIVTDLALGGPARTQSSQINEAVLAELRARDFKAGTHTIGLLTCDNSSSAAKGSDPKRCSANANAYSGDETILAVVGPLDSRCTAAELSLLNQAPDGPIPLVSPTNAYPCLTRGGPGCDLSEPGRYYPTGARNYLRLAGSDLYQAAADAEIAREQGMKRVYVLDDHEAYGVGLATAFRNAAEHTGVEVVGAESWHSRAKSFAQLLHRIRSSGADAIFLAGSIDNSGARLLREKVAVLGPNDGPVRVLATDLFADAGALAEAGPAARGLLVSVPGVPTSAFPPAGKAYAKTLAADLPSGQAVDPAAIHGAEAARIVLDAIAASDGSRTDVLARLSRTRVRDGLIGSFSFDRNGDPADATGPIVGFTVLRMGQELEPVDVVEPSPATVRAAATGT